MLWSMSPMRRLACTVIAVMTASTLAVGCSPEASVPATSEDKPIDRQPQKPLSAEQPGLTAQLILDDNFLKLLASNEINGFDIAIGMKKEEVIKRYGAVVKQDFLDGGQSPGDGYTGNDSAGMGYACMMKGKAWPTESICFCTKRETTRSLSVWKTRLRRPKKSGSSTKKCWMSSRKNFHDDSFACHCKKASDKGRNTAFAHWLFCVGQETALRLTQPLFFQTKWNRGRTWSCR